jgi:hypothetical protein
MYIGQLTHKGIRTEQAAATFELDASITENKDVGKLVSLKGNHLVGLADDGDVIFGYLESFEDRVAEGSKTGAVSWMLCGKATYVGTPPVVGAGLEGSATLGSPQASAAGVSNIVVTQVDTDEGTCEFILR